MLMIKMTKPELIEVLAIAHKNATIPTLSYADFSGIDLSGIELKHVYFCECDFTCTLFACNQIENCCFDKCNLTKAHFYEVNCKMTTFERCDLSEIRFLACDLSTAIFHNTISMKDADLSFSDCRGMDFPAEAQNIHCLKTNLAGATFYGNVAKTWKLHCVLSRANQKK